MNIFPCKNKSMGQDTHKIIWKLNLFISEPGNYNF